MGLFGKLLSKKRTESISVVEIGPDSIAGGLVYFAEGQLPLLVYGVRMPVEPSLNEAPTATAARTLSALGDRLIREGAPRLMRIAGKGSVDAVLASVKAPWQETFVRSEKIERTSPFVFSKALLATALEKSAEPPKGRLLADEFVVGTMLDGYIVREPVGKRASYANIIVLSSFIDEPLSLGIAGALRKLFHTTSIRLVAAAALRYEALRAALPHEEDYLIVDVSGDAVVTSLVRHGLLSAVEHAMVPEKRRKGAWVSAFTKTLEAITARYPLPHKMILLAGEGERNSLKQEIEAAPLASLRLSVEPPMVISLGPSQLTEAVRLSSDVEPDLGLELMAAFWKRMEW